MTTGNEDLDLQALWDETDEDGLVLNVPAEDDTPPAEEVDPTDEPDDTPVEDDPVDDTPAEEPEIVDYKALWEKSQNEVKTMTGRLRAETERLARERDELASKLPPANVEPTEEEKFLGKFREEYSDDVIKAIDLITTRKATQLIEQQFSQRLAPVEQSTYNMVEQQHFGAIEAAHPDLDQINASPEFDAWLNNRPAHTKGAYQYVRENGTPAEVISMLNEYKSSLPQKETKQTPPSAKKVDSAMAVQRRRGTVQTAAEPDESDLEALWNSIPD